MEVFIWILIAIGVWYSAICAAAVEIDDTGRIVNLSPVGTVTRGDQSR